MSEFKLSDTLRAQALKLAEKQFPEFPPEEVVQMVEQQRADRIRAAQNRGPATPAA